MRAALLAILLAFVASPCWAYGNFEYYPFTKTPSESTKVHVMIVVDDTTISVDTKAQNDAAIYDEYAQFMGFRGALTRAGIEWHVYTYRQLTANMKLWHDAGLPRSQGGGGYAVALMPYWQNHNFYRGVHGAPFFRGDSTSIHIIHYGGTSPSGSGRVWQDGDANQNLMFGSCNTEGTMANLRVPTVTGTRWDSTVVVGTTADTFFYSRISWIKARGTLRPLGVSKVVRLFRMADGTPAQTDSLSPTTYNDDQLHIAYRVWYTNPSPYGGLATPYVDFVLGADNNSGYTSNTASVLWALTSRWVRLPAVKVAMIGVNYGLFGSNPRWPSRPAVYNAGNRANWAWPRASYCDSVMRDLYNRFGVKKVVIATQPDSLAWLFANYPAYETAARSWTWAEWSVKWGNPQDSLSRFRCPSGIAWSTDSTYGVGFESRRVANRFDPTNATAAIRFGIPQSFYYQDSVLASLGLKNNKVYCPVDQRHPNRSATVWLVGGAARDYPGPGTHTAAADFATPAESLFVGMANAGRMYIVDTLMPDPGGVQYSNPQGFEFPRPLQTGNQGYRWSIIPDQNYVTHDGRKIRLLASHGENQMSVGTLGDPVASGPADFTHGVYEGVIDNQRTISALLGLTSVRFGMLSTAFYDGETDALLYGGPANEGYRAWDPGMGRARIYTFNFQYIGNVPHGWHDDYYQHFVIRCLQSIHALEVGIAGHQLIEWVSPQEAADAVP